MACQPALTDGLNKDFCINPNIIDAPVSRGEVTTGVSSEGGYLDETPRDWGINAGSYVRVSSDGHAQTLIEAQDRLAAQFSLNLQFIHCNVYGEQAWVDADLPAGEFNQSFLDQMTSTEHDRIAVTRAGIKTVESDFMTDAGGTERQKGALYWTQAVTVGSVASPASKRKKNPGDQWQRRVYYGIIDAFRENKARISSEGAFYYAQYLDRDQVSEMASMNTDSQTPQPTDEQLIAEMEAIIAGDAPEEVSELYTYAHYGSVDQYRKARFNLLSEGQESIAGQTGQQVKTCLLDATCNYRTVYEWALEKYKDYFALRVYQHLAEQESEFDDDHGRHGAFEPGRGEEDLEAERELAKKLAQAAMAITAGVAPELELAGYREQCFLLSNLDFLVDYRWKNVAKEVKPLPYVAPPEVEGAENYVGNACLQVVGDTFSFINKLTQYPTQLALFKARPYQLSSLQPKIRLYKLSEDADGVESEQEFNFAGAHRSTGPTDFLTNKDVRGYGVGIKDFSFTYDGSNPFAVKKSIKATLQIFANNFDELLKMRGNYRYIDLALKTGGPETTARAVNADTHDELDKLNFRLKAVVGWALPPDMEDAEFWKFYNMTTGAEQAYGSPAQGQVKALKEAIKHSYVTLNLTPTVHDFAFDEMGRVTFTINYLAYIEDFFDQNTFNIFSNVEIGGRMLSRQLEFNSLSADCNSDAISQFKEREQNAIKNDKVASLQQLMKSMVENKKIRFLNLGYDELIRWQKMGAFAGPVGGEGTQTRGFSISEMPTDDQSLINEIETSARARDAGDEFGEAQWNTDRINEVLNSTEKQQLPYFYVFNLIDQVLAGIENYLTAMPDTIDTFTSPVTPQDKEEEKQKIEKFKKHFKKFRAVLGPIEIVSPKDPSQKYLISLGDLPVSVKFFIDWLTEKLLQKEESVYPLPMFLNDFFNVLIRNYLNDDTCFKVPIKQRVRMAQTSLTDYASSEYGAGIDTLTALAHLARHARSGGEDTPQKDWPLIISTPGPGAFLLPENASPSQYVSYPVLNIAGPEGGDGRGPLSKETNYLIYYGGRATPKEAMNGDVIQDRDRGIMHYIMGEDVGIVKKIDLKKTSSPGLKEVRFEQDGYDGLKQLREVYDAEITTFADVGAFPGKYIFVDPRGFAPQSAGVGDSKRTDLTEFGVGGYYMIYRSEHSFGAGKAESRLSAKWVAERTGVTREEGAEEDNNEYAINRPRPEKCQPQAGGAPAFARVTGQGDLQGAGGDRSAADTVGSPNKDIYSGRDPTAAGPSGADVIPTSGTEK